MRQSLFQSAAFAMACAAAAQLFWSGNVIASRAIYAAIDPIMLNFLRWAIASVLLLPVLYHHRLAVAQALREAPLQMAFLALTGVTGFNMVMYAGLQFTGAVEAGIIFALTPILIITIAWIWGGAPLVRNEILGSLLAFAGVVLVITMRGGGGAGSNPLLGGVFIFASTLIWSFYTVALKRFTISLSPYASLAVLAPMGSLMMLVLLPWSSTPFDVALHRADVAWALVYMVAAASILAFAAWQAGVAVLGAGRAGVFLQLMPVFSVSLAALLLGEPVGLLEFLGLAIVIAGVVTAQQKPRIKNAAATAGKTPSA